jgi:site-specific recombinase XerD
MSIMEGSGTGAARAAVAAADETRRLAVTPATRASAAPSATASGGREAAIAAAVAALPGLSADPGRYGVRAVTAAWLAETSSPHTARAYFRDLSTYLTWCHTDQLDPLTARPADLGRYRAHLEQTAAASTAHRRLAALSSWYRFLTANGAAGGNPVAGVRRPRVDRDASATAGLTPDEVRVLLHRADTEVTVRAAALAAAPTPTRGGRHLAALRDRALLRTLADLGLRVGEAVALDVGALGHNRGYRTLRYRGKGNKMRERALSAHALEAIDDYLTTRAAGVGVGVEKLTGPLFATTSRAATDTAGRLDPAAVFRLIRRLAATAGLPAANRLSPHSLRHAFATTARELGVPLEDVQDALGHADPRTTRRYDRARHALHREPGLRLGELYADTPRQSHAPTDSPSAAPTSRG